jgi:hypothetical protein
MDSQSKIAKLKLAETLGNVSEACRIGGISRSQFYKYKARYDKYGFEGLKNFSPIHKSHPFTTPLEIEQKIIRLSLKHPSYGCKKLKELFYILTGHTISNVTIQKILNRNNLGTQYHRWLALEDKYFKKKLKNLTDEQIAFIEKNNPAFKERHFESNRPGEIFCMDVIGLHKTSCAIPAYMYIVIIGLNVRYSPLFFGCLIFNKIKFLS